MNTRLRMRYLSSIPRHRQFPQQPEPGQQLLILITPRGTAIRTQSTIFAATDPSKSTTTFRIISTTTSMITGGAVLAGIPGHPIGAAIPGGGGVRLQLEPSVPHGPTLCFRGSANDAYYILEADRSHCANYTGTGNILNGNNSIVPRMIVD